MRYFSLSNRVPEVSALEPKAVAWLYGLMYLAGFALNYVTATIGAVSIGVGIDYSIHMTERFREETHRASSKLQALRQAAG